MKTRTHSLIHLTGQKALVCPPLYFPSLRLKVCDTMSGFHMDAVDQNSVYHAYAGDGLDELSPVLAGL